MNNVDPYTYFTLPNGLRVAHRHEAGSAEYCGVAVRAGSRDETPATYGLAHFVEHTIFKGTGRRRSWHIINRMESVGGELNAYTSEETTVIYSAFPAGNLVRAVELISDLVANSRFPQAEIDREREVVMDEIDSYLDTPSDAVFDDFNDLIFAGTPLGHNILGNEDTLRSFTPDTCRDFLDRFYTPGDMVFFYTGPESAVKVEKIALRYLGQLSRPTTARPESPLAPADTFDKRRHTDTHQAHTVMGARIPGMYSDEAPVYALLTNLIGGPCMNSLLNVALRERRGYVYSVDAYTSLFTDTGLFTVYFGCDPEHIRPCRTLVERTVTHLSGTPLSARALAAAKRQYIGQMTVAAQSREQSALSLGRATLFHGRALTDAEQRDRIEAVTPEALRAAAERLTRLSTLTFS